MQIKRTNNPSTPISEAAANVAIMEILSLDWMSIGTLHYLIIVEKVTSFIWSRLFSHMSTSNSLSMLSDIIAEHGTPKLVVSDSGPSFRGEFVQSLLALHIDHSSSSAYMAKTNGRAEKAVQLVKKMLLLNPPRSAKNLQELTSAVNNRPSGVQGGGSTYEIFFRRRPLLLLPCLPKPLTPEEKSLMAEKMAKHREHYRAKYAHTRLVEYKIDDEVLCFDPKMKSTCK